VRLLVSGLGCWVWRVTTGSGFEGKGCGGLKQWEFEGGEFGNRGLRREGRRIRGGGFAFEVSGFGGGSGAQGARFDGKVQKEVGIKKRQHCFQQL